VFANLHAARGGGNRPELAANFGRGVGLEVPHVLRGRAAEQVEQDDVLRLARPHAGGFLLFRREQFREREAAAEQGERAGGERLASGDAVAAAARAAEHGNHRACSGRERGGSAGGIY
jgi:hypothetical protein